MIKHYTLIEWHNSLIVPSGVAIFCNLCYDGRAGENPKERLPKRKMHGSRHQSLFEENVRKIKKIKGLRILKIRIRELFTRGEGISTPRARHKGRQPLIECAQRDFRIIYFSFFVFVWVDKGVALTPTYPWER